MRCPVLTYGVPLQLATRCPILTWGIPLPGDDGEAQGPWVSTAIALRARYAISGADLAHDTGVRACESMRS
eukprot:2169340-Rhodomonas_salina.2